MCKDQLVILGQIILHKLNFYCCVLCVYSANALSLYGFVFVNPGCLYTYPLLILCDILHGCFF